MTNARDTTNKPLKSLTRCRVLVLALLLALSAPRGKAELVTYDFSGTLTATVDGISSVTGWFTLDTEADSLTAWDFDLAPIGIEAKTDGASLTNELGFLALNFDYPWGSPSAPVSNYVLLVFTPPISLADLHSIDITPIGNPSITSGVIDDQNGISAAFNSGSTLVETPEPTGMGILLGAVLLACKRLVPSRSGTPVDLFSLLKRGRRAEADLA